jgi:hypothetical protein
MPNRSLRGGSWIALAIAALFPIVAAADKPSTPAPLQLTFANSTVSVKGITPGADVYLFSVSREAKGYYNSIIPREALLHDPAKRGQADFMLDHPIPTRSIWFAVDLSTGAAVAGTPDNYRAAQPLQVDGRHLKNDPDGDVAKLAYEGALVDVVVVRPGAGIWGGTIGLHDKKDEGGHGDKFVTVSTVNLEPRLGTASVAPAKLKKGDVVFMLDSYAAKYSLYVVGGGK